MSVAFVALVGSVLIETGSSLVGTGEIVFVSAKSIDVHMFHYMCTKCMYMHVYLCLYVYV